MGLGNKTIIATLGIYAAFNVIAAIDQTRCEYNKDLAADYLFNLSANLPVDDPEYDLAHQSFENAMDKKAISRRIGENVRNFLGSGVFANVAGGTLGVITEAVVAPGLVVGDVLGSYGANMTFKK